MSAGAPLRILIADDHEVMREGTRAVISRQPGWEVCGIAETGREAVQQAVALKPDIVVMDVTLPELDGLDTAIQIKNYLPLTEILFFTAHSTNQLIRDSFAAGVKSFINKAAPHRQLVQAVESLAQHKPFLTNDVCEILFTAMLDRADRASDAMEPGQRLSAREREVVQLLCEGKTNNEIAVALGISVRTAETHRANLLRKLKLDSIAGLVRYAIRNKMIEP